MDTELWLGQSRLMVFETIGVDFYLREMNDKCLEWCH